MSDPIPFSAHIDGKTKMLENAVTKLQQDLESQGVVGVALAVVFKDGTGANTYSAGEPGVKQTIYMTLDMLKDMIRYDTYDAEK